MSDTQALDRLYDVVMKSFVARGQAPHFTEISSQLGVPPGEGRRLLHELIRTGLPNWLFPETDLIASFAPFYNLPTQYRLTIDGEQRWFAQCGLESLAVSWLFPGKTVVVGASCLDCGGPLRVAVRDGQILEASPAGTCFYVDLPIREWYGNLPHA